ncbi:MAG: hypothetical protein AVDCRST_MAG79-2337, partial [uncultured Thermoleophilia bacterium]
ARPGPAAAGGRPRTGAHPRPPVGDAGLARRGRRHRLAHAGDPRRRRGRPARPADPHRPGRPAARAARARRRAPGRLPGRERLSPRGLAGRRRRVGRDVELRGSPRAREARGARARRVARPAATDVRAPGGPARAPDAVVGGRRHRRPAAGRHLLRARAGRPCRGQGQARAGRVRRGEGPADRRPPAPRAVPPARPRRRHAHRFRRRV